MAALFAVSLMSAHSTSEREKAIKLGEKVLNEVAAEGKKLGVEVEKMLEYWRIIPDTETVSEENG